MAPSYNRNDGKTEPVFNLFFKELTFNAILMLEIYPLIQLNSNIQVQIEEIYQLYVFSLFPALYIFLSAGQSETLHPVKVYFIAPDYRVPLRPSASSLHYIGSD